jgi:4-amino-4-deoxychorismate lyase
MSRFIETIQLLNGKLLNLEFHQERFERTRKEVLGLRKHPRLEEVIRIPEGLETGRLKCRLTYRKEIELFEFEAQLVHEVRTLKLVYADSIDYGYKYADRRELEELFRQRKECDDILVVKNGNLSDSFYANVVLWNGKHWETPDTPLLPGTMRASLLRKGSIRERRITPEDLPHYKVLKLINAMNNMENAREISIDSIF